MRPEVQQAIALAFQIAQDATSEGWEPTIARALPGAYGTWVTGDFQAISRVANALVIFIAEFGKRTEEEVKKVFESHRNFPTQEEQGTLERQLEASLRSAVDYAVNRMKSIGCSDARQFESLLERFREKCGRDRTTACHAFTLMLVDQRSKWSPTDGTVTGSPSRLGKRRLVILVHGIRTRAEWQGRLRGLFVAIPQTTVVPIGYPRKKMYHEQVRVTGALPHGMSGGAVWHVGADGLPIVVAIATNYDAGMKFMRATRINPLLFRIRDVLRVDMARKGATPDEETF